MQPLRQNIPSGVTAREPVIVRKDGVEMQLPLDQARKFSVFERAEITLSIGDRVRFTKNIKHREQKFLNNGLRTVVGIDDGKITLDKGEIVRNGAALHIDQGIAVTSHASQAKTVDQVIVSVPVGSFSQANEAQFYVSMSRARFAMHLFTDSKVALRDAVTRPSTRRLRRRACARRRGFTGRCSCTWHGRFISAKYVNRG